MRNAASFIASQSGPEAGILHAVIRKAHETIEAWKNRRQIATLVDFDDRMLADIGLDPARCSRSPGSAVFPRPGPGAAGPRLAQRVARMERLNSRETVPHTGQPGSNCR